MKELKVQQHIQSTYVHVSAYIYMIGSCATLFTRFCCAISTCVIQKYAHTLGVILISVLVFGPFALPRTATAEGWYNASWSYRVLLTVNNTEVDADLTDFPVYVDLSDLPAGFHTNVKTDGSDIRVTTSDGQTEVPREVVFYSSATDTGELHFKAPTLANATNTEFYIYYGNAAATEPATDATYGAENVWDASYKGVYHLKDGSTLTLTDSTATQNGTNSNATPSTGKIDGGANVVGSQYIDLGQTTAHYNPITVSSWIKPSATGGTQQQIISKGYDGTNTQWQLVTDPGSTVSFNSFTNPNTNGAVSASTVSNGTWYYVGGVYDTTTWRVYFNGVADGSSVDTAPTNTNQKIAIGGVFSSGSIVQNWRGDIDEVRISNVVRSPEWIATEYNNQSVPSTFYTVGSEEEQSGGDVPARVLRLKGGIRLTGGVRLSGLAAAEASSPTVSTAAATSISIGAATLNAAVDDTGGENATICGFAWGTNSGLSGGDTATTTDSTCPSGTGSFNESLSGLSGGVTYYFRAYATNPIGTGFGGILQFTTDVGGPI